MSKLKAKNKLGKVRLFCFIYQKTLSDGLMILKLKMFVNQKYFINVQTEHLGSNFNENYSGELKKCQRIS